jgi:hypothetical protein
VGGVGDDGELGGFGLAGGVLVGRGWLVRVRVCVGGGGSGRVSVVMPPGPLVVVMIGWWCVVVAGGVVVGLVVFAGVVDVVGVSCTTGCWVGLPAWITGAGCCPAGAEAADVVVTVAMVASTVASATPPPASTTSDLDRDGTVGGGSIRWVSGCSPCCSADSGPVGSVTISPG